MIMSSRPKNPSSIAPGQPAPGARQRDKFVPLPDEDGDAMDHLMAGGAGGPTSAFALYSTTPPGGYGSHGVEGGILAGSLGPGVGGGSPSIFEDLPTTSAADDVVVPHMMPYASPTGVVVGGGDGLLPLGAIGGGLPAAVAEDQRGRVS